ncbi:phytanoyl-CoA dioxygenase family protein [Zavarzinella formosa]|uniref:phytanoyl-CoA dioxygenase family protein n=1 Tax=Zavarzinella formosa TaxID=360055 RepID=UPI0002E05130|nr:phytanoyl-CoA dioxygenase family protein [Zavarzinella formosa]
MTATSPKTTTDYRAAFERDGFFVVRSLFDPALMRKALAEADQLMSDHARLKNVKNIRCRWQDNVFTGECTFETFDPVIDLGPVCDQLAHHPRLLSLLATVYGEPAHLFKDKLIYKPPGVKGYGLHQDWISWEGFPKSFLTVLIPFDPADRDNGCTVVYPGYHTAGSLTPQDGQYHELPADTVDESLAEPLILEPGDVAVFGGFTPHRSDPNISDRWRRQLYLSYNAHSDGGDQREKHYREFHAWLKIKYAEYGKTETYFE